LRKNYYKNKKLVTINVRNKSFLRLASLRTSQAEAKCA